MGSREEGKNRDENRGVSEEDEEEEEGCEEEGENGVLSLLTGLFRERGLSLDGLSSPPLLLLLLLLMLLLLLLFDSMSSSRPLSPLSPFSKSLFLSISLLSSPMHTTTTPAAISSA